MLVEIIPRHRTQNSFFVFNGYSSPREKVAGGHRLAKDWDIAISKAGPSPLVVVGDFNAPHPDWGYKYISPKGNFLRNKIQSLNLNLLNDFTHPTRVGNSICSDTSPDLSMCLNAHNPSWLNLWEELGSDHRIIETTVWRSGKRDDYPQRKIPFTDWDSFRTTRSDRPPTELTNLDEWTHSLLEDHKSNTTLENDVPNEAEGQLDTRLRTLLQAKHSITSRWNKCRLKKSLRKKLAEINRKIEAHCATLRQQNWDRLCEETERNLHGKRAWQLLRHLLNPTTTKSARSDAITTVIHNATHSTGATATLKLYMYKEHQTFFQIHTRDGFVIPVVPTIKILGLSIDGDRSSATAFGRLIQKMNETIQLVKRITRKHAGMGEKGLLRLIQAFVVPHISYLAPFLALDAVKLDKLNKKMRKLYKVALGIPVGTNNQRLEEMGIHNTIEEIIEAQGVSHTERLMHTSTGRKVLQDIGHIITNGVDRTAIPGVCLLDIRPLPRHMHPDEHQERRLARAKALTTIHNSNPKSFFTDVSEYPGMRTRFAIAVINGMGETIRQASTRAQSPTDAEEIAIALAYTIPTCEHILSDSKSAITNYARNWITKHTSTLLRKAHNPNRVTITWYPAHTQSSPADGNERAHQSARNLTRDIQNPHVQALVFRKCSIALKLNNEDGEPAQAPVREEVKEAQVFIIQHALKALAHHEPGLKVSP
ncbi:hypothetical protein HPB47_009590 [Ixodes persulcatus]|uniref:Uncharacterized protein n=1 Tax=Ixodes persulcatus TaxID=34615 RepID=A0AC60P1N9_IXOPE|nr:hypothetical protein HPB47_009590 [Ixodes persulcatus]